jgi:hypothetical protein
MPIRRASLRADGGVNEPSRFNQRFANYRGGGFATLPVQTGSAWLLRARLTFAILHHIVTGQRPAVPLETALRQTYLLAFDNTAGRVLCSSGKRFGPGAIQIVIRTIPGK